MKALTSKVTLVLVGVLNLIHGGLHLIQVIQSLVLLQNSDHHENPWLSVLWFIVGIVSIVIGIKDFNHHNNCK